MAAEVIKIEIPIEVSDNTNPALDNIVSRLNNLGKEAKNAQSAVSASEKAFQKAASGTGTTSLRTSGFEKAYQKAQKALRSLNGQKSTAVLEAKDRISSVLSKANSGLNKIAGKTFSATLKLATAPVRAAANLVSNPVTQLTALAGVGIGMTDTVSTYSDFGATMSRVQALANANSEQMAALTAKAKEMGAVTKYSGTESAEAFTYMAQAGWQVQDMIDGIGGVMSLAAADGLDLATTTDIVSNALTAFGMSAKDTAEFADVMAVASSATNTDVYDLGEAFKYIAPVAGAMGYSIQDASLALGLMSNNAVKGSMAGTSLKTALANMAAPTDNMAAAMDRYGISLTDSEGNMKTLKGVMDNLRSSLGGLSETEQTAAASTIFGKEAMAGMLAIINTSEADYNRLTAAINNSEGAADSMAETMQDNMAGALEQMGGAIETAQLTLGERLEPYIIGLADTIQNAMPMVEDGIIQFMDAFDRRAEAVREKIREFTSTEDWENADFFGKVKIAWDELIAEPFSEWWNGEGKASMSEKAMQIGQSIGEGLSGGLLTLLGLDVDAGIKEGTNIGKSFAEGFISGFDVDAVKGALGGAVKGLFSNAGKLFTGEGDLSSIISAATIAKAGIPLISLLGKGISFGKSAYNAGKGIFGSKVIESAGEVATVVPGLGSRILGSAKTGKGILGFGANTAINLGAGNLAGGASLSTGALSAVGLGAVAGGAVGGATLIGGAVDFYKGFKSDDEKESSAYKKSGGWKVGGVGAGAAAGAAIGGIFGGIGAIPGALIGAGVGGIAGWIKGDSEIEKYEEQKQAAEEAAAAEALMAEKTKYALKGSRFESEALTEAFEDTSVSAEQFGLMMQEAASDKIKDSFGDIRLSMEEIKEAAKQILFNGDDSKLTKYAAAADDAQASLSSLQSTQNSMAKLNWKAGLGMITDSQGADEYRAGIDAMLQSAEQYVEDQHYQATAAISLLVQPGSPVNMTSGLNAMYEQIQGQLEDASSNLTAKMNIALEDGVITMDEQAELQNLQQQVTDITNQISEAQSEASMQAISIKYSGAELDAESFANLTAELQAQAQEAAAQYDDALEVSLTNLNLQLETGAINEEQFNSQLTALTEGYQAHINELAVNIESFQFSTIEDAFGAELDGILPELEGSVGERLSQAMNNALAAGVDVANWDVGTAAEWLDLDGLSGETQAALTDMVSQIAQSLPEQFTSALEGTGGMGETVSNMLTQSVEGIDTSAFGESMVSKFAEGMAGLDYSGMTAGIQEGIASSFQSAMEGADFSASSEAIRAGLQESVQSAAEGADYSAAGTAAATGVGSAIGSADMGQISAGIQTLYGNTGSQINSTFATPFSTTATVNVTLDWNIVNPTASISVPGGGSTSVSASISAGKRAEGGFTNGPELSWIGEDGPEAIIPLGSKRRSRGIALWEAAGNMLGIPGYADGGIVGAAGNPLERRFIDEEKEPVNYARNVEEKSDQKQPVQVTVNLSPRIQISGGDTADIRKQIADMVKDMADDLAAELGERLADTYSNMPIRH